MAVTNHAIDVIFIINRVLGLNCTHIKVDAGEVPTSRSGAATFTNSYLKVNEAMMNPFEKDVLTTGEVAKICNVAARTVSKWFDSGQLEGYRIPGSKDRRIPVQGLMKFMQAHGIPLDGLMSGNTRVLIVDSDKEVVSALERVFSEQTEYVVHSSSNPFAAGLECERFRPHVMLFDLSFCGDEYASFANTFQGNDDLQATKVIAMTGRLTDGQMTHLTCSGFDGVLTKPFTVRQVIEAIENAVALVY